MEEAEVKHFNDINVELRFAPRNQLQNVFITNRKVSDWKAHFRTVIQLISVICEILDVTDSNYGPKIASQPINNVENVQQLSNFIQLLFKSNHAIKLSDNGAP